MYQDAMKKYDAYTQGLIWHDGFWMGFTTGAIVVVVLQAIIHG